MYARGLALGAEARGKGVNILLGPTVGPSGRKPRGGRNWEGFGADPVLQAEGGAQTIKGVQANGVIATIKHFVGNEQEMYRMDIIPHGLMRAISSNIDDRTLHELYAWPFAEGIRAGVGAVMTSYNEVGAVPSPRGDGVLTSTGQRKRCQPKQQADQWYPQRRDGLPGPGKLLGWLGQSTRAKGARS